MENLNYRVSHVQEGTLTGKGQLLATINSGVIGRNSILTYSVLPKKASLGQEFPMTVLFQKVNHLGKSELDGSAGYVIGTDIKKYYSPPFPKVNKLCIFQVGEKQNIKNLKFNNQNIIRKTKSSLVLTLHYTYTYKFFPVITSSFSHFLKM
jgi:hypothetical protein